jgi:hypothetical protein
MKYESSAFSACAIFKPCLLEVAGWFCHLAPGTGTRYYNLSAIPRRKKVAWVYTWVCRTPLPQHFARRVGSLSDQYDALGRPRHSSYLPPLSAIISRKRERVEKHSLYRKFVTNFTVVSNCPSVNVAARGSVYNVLDEALCYKPNGPEFEIRWDELFLAVYLILPATCNRI